MFCQPGFDQWLATIRTHLPHLSKPQATVLALWSLGMVLARSCAVSAVSAVLAKGRTRMSDPARAARLWLAVAVATLWLLSVGGEADEAIPASTLHDVTALGPGRPRRATRLRLVSVFRQGWSTILVAVLRHEPLPEGRLVPEPWPAVTAWDDQDTSVLPRAA